MANVKIVNYYKGLASQLNELRTSDSIINQILALPSENIDETHAYFSKSKSSVYSFVAMIDNVVVGYLRLKPINEPRRSHKAILSIAINCHYHNQGIGTLLMKTGIEFAKNWTQLQQLQLSVLCSNTKAISLYHKFNFKDCGVIPNDSLVCGRLEDVQIMLLEL